MQDDNIFIETPKKVNRKKTKKEMSDDEYVKVCERMAQLRAARKNGSAGSAPKPVKEKEVIKYVDRPVEVVKEVIKEVEVPAKTERKHVDLFDQIDNEQLKKELLEVKNILVEMKVEKAAKRAQKAALEQVKVNPEPAKPAEPAKLAPEPAKPVPEQAKPAEKLKPAEPAKRLIYTGPMGLFRPF